MTPAAVLAAWLAVAATPQAAEPAAPASRASLAVDVGASLMQPSLHAALEGSLRVLGRSRLLVRAEWNPWLTLQQTGGKVNRGTLNVGAGAELRYFDERMSSSVMLGASFLLFQSAFDPPGTFGPFLALAPATFRFPLSERFVLRVEPLALQLLAPSLGSIPLIVLQYRHSVSLELQL